MATQRNAARGAPPVDLPLRYPSASIFIDESGSKASASSFFVVAGAKVRAAGKLARAVKSVRDQTGFTGEFKFAAITRGALPAYYALIDVVEQSDLHVCACVVDREVSNPFRGSRPLWAVQAEVASQLLVGAINRREVVSAFLDMVTTPVDIALDDVVRQTVNRRLGRVAVVTATSLDSRSTDLLQVADLFASAIAFERRRSNGEGGNVNSHKAKVSGRLKTALGLTTFEDGRSDRSNIATFRPSARKGTERRLHAAV